jgi:hypothetical protein
LFFSRRCSRARICVVNHERKVTHLRPSISCARFCRPWRACDPNFQSIPENDAELFKIPIGQIAENQARQPAAPICQIEMELFITGLGSGSSMMPAMSAALGALRRDEVARATTGLNVVLRVGGSIGTALVAVVLTHQLARLLGFRQCRASPNFGGLRSGALRRTEPKTLERRFAAKTCGIVCGAICPRHPA